MNISIKNFFSKLYISLWIWIISLLCIFFVDWWLFNRKQWLELNWWVRLLYKMDFSQYEKNYKDKTQLNDQKNNVISIVNKNIDWRISKLWVSDYSSRYVVMWWQDYIEISLWWVQDLEKAKEIIWKTVRMTFKVPFEWNVSPEIKNERQLLAEKILLNIQSNQFTELEDYLNPEAWWVMTTQTSLTWEALYNLFWTWIEQNLTWSYVYPKLIETNDSFNIYQFASKDWDNYNFIQFIVSFTPLRTDAKINWSLLNWERFKMAQISRDQSWTPAVSIDFDDQWRTMFYQLTKKYIKKQMAIFIWDKMITNPVIQVEIPWWQAQITWRFTAKEVNEMIDELNTWAMPISLNLAQEEKVSPILWEKALLNSVIAAVIWVFLIFIMFLIFFWFKYAIVTILSLMLFFIVLWGFVKLSWTVLSLSAIGAIILNIGMAVDANVLIFERIREDLKKWSSRTAAIISWYQNSYSAIRDGNFTTWLIAFLLFMIGNNIFKWFGFMMIVNIFIVLFVMVPAIPALLYLFKRK